MNEKELIKAAYQVFHSMQLRVGYWMVMFHEPGVFRPDFFSMGILLDVITTEIKGKGLRHCCFKTNVFDDYFSRNRFMRYINFEVFRAKDVSLNVRYRPSRIV